MKNRFAFLALASLMLSSCGASDYHYTNPEEPVTHWECVPEEGVVVDGLPNESFYSQVEEFVFAPADFPEKKMSMKVYFAPKGLVIYGYRAKEAIYENPSLKIFQQDSFEVYINPTPFKDRLRPSCLQLRLSPNNRVESWIGLESFDGYSWTYLYRPFAAKAHVDGKVITNSKENIDDNKHSKGVGYEFYIPYTSFGLDYNPQGADILPAFVDATNITGGSFNWCSCNGIGITELNRFPTFGNRVYKDQTGNLFDTDFTNTGFDLSHQHDESPFLTQSGINDQYAQFNHKSSCWYVESDVNLLSLLHLDDYPKVGFATYNTKGTKAFLLDPRPNKDNYEALLVDRLTGGDWEWTKAPINWKGEKTYLEPIKMGMARYEDGLYCFMNGAPVFVSDTKALGDEASYPAFLTMNYSAIYDNIKIETDETLVFERVKNLIDGDIDWSRTTSGFGVDEDGTVIQVGTGDQYLFVNDSASDYEFSCDIQLGLNLEGDQFPKVGIGERNSSRTNLLLLDPRPSKDNYQCLLVKGTGDGKDWDWDHDRIGWNGPETYTGTISLKVVREGDKSTYYMNGEVLFVSEDNGLGGQDSTPVLMTMNHSAYFYNVTYTAK